AGGLADRQQHRPEAEGASAPRAQGRLVMATAAKAAPPTVAPGPPADPLIAYYGRVRQMNLQLAKDRYKQGFKVRTQEYIRGGRRQTGRVARSGFRSCSLSRACARGTGGAVIWPRRRAHRS